MEHAAGSALRHPDDQKAATRAQLFRLRYREARTVIVVPSSATHGVLKTGPCGLGPAVPHASVGSAAV